MDIPTIATIVTVCLSFATFFIGRMTAKHDEGKTAGNVVSDIENLVKSMDNVNDSIKDMEKRQRETEAKQEKRHLEVIERLASVESTYKSMEGRLNRLEKQRG